MATQVTVRDAIATLHRELDAEVIFVRFKDRRGMAKACKICACTDFDVCPGGCHWIEPGLCSSHQ